MKTAVTTTGEGQKHVFEACLAWFEHSCYKSYKRSIGHPFDGQTDGGLDECSSCLGHRHRTGGRAGALAWAAGAPAPLTSVPCGEAAVTRPAAPVRITRAGRLAVTLTVAVALVVLALVLFPSGASGTVIDHSTTVQSGQTLSEVAASELPQLPVATRSRASRSPTT